MYLPLPSAVPSALGSPPLTFTVSITSLSLTDLERTLINESKVKPWLPKSEVTVGAAPACVAEVVRVGPAMIIRAE